MSSQQSRPGVGAIVLTGDDSDGMLSVLRSELAPKHVALAVKEMHFLPQDVIESGRDVVALRGLVDGNGAAIEPSGGGLASVVTAVWVSLGLGFGMFVWLTRGSQAGGEYLAGYLTAAPVMVICVARHDLLERGQEHGRAH